MEQLFSAPIFTMVVQSSLLNIESSDPHETTFVHEPRHACHLFVFVRERPLRGLKAPEKPCSTPVFFHPDVNKNNHFL